MTITVAITGATGYAGGEILRLLATHPHVEVKTVAAHSSAGSRLGDLAPPPSRLCRPWSLPIPPLKP